MLKELLPNTLCSLLLVSFWKSTSVSLHHIDKIPNAPQEESMFISAHCLRNSRPWFQVLVLWAGGSTVLHGKRSAHLIVGRKQRQKGPGFLTAPVTAPVGACTLWPNFLLLGTSSYRFFQLFPVVAQARNQAEGLLKAPSPKLQRVTHMCLSWLLPQPSQKPISTKLCVM